MRIIGVDFSGAGSDESVGKTWLAQGWLDDHALALENPRSISRADLTAELKSLKEQAVVAMDFPFSVPAEFASFWQRFNVLADGWKMPDVWAAASPLSMQWTNAKDLPPALRLDKFKCEPKRPCDPPESFSPLHTTNPNMVPMTIRGMAMLHDIWAGQTANSVLVPPLAMPRRGTGTHTTTLLEVMPGAVLHGLRLPFKGYKDGRGQEQRKQRRQVREFILENLPNRVDRVQVDLFRAYDKCLSNAPGDALDSVVAAIAAALWATDSTLFHLPPEQGQPNYDRVQLEGWLYTPRGHCPRCGDIPPVQE